MPGAFASLQQYADVFHALLQEELRASVQQVRFDSFLAPSCPHATARLSAHSASVFAWRPSYGFMIQHALPRRAHCGTPNHAGYVTWAVMCCAGLRAGVAFKRPECGGERPAAAEGHPAAGQAAHGGVQHA